MGLESASYVGDLVITNPVGSDGVAAGDDHIRLLKTVLKATFPNASGAINPSVAEFNTLVGATGASAHAGITPGFQWTFSNGALYLLNTKFAFFMGTFTAASGSASWATLMTFQAGYRPIADYAMLFGNAYDASTGNLYSSVWNVSTTGAVTHIVNAPFTIATGDIIHVQGLMRVAA